MSLVDLVDLGEERFGCAEESTSDTDSEVSRRGPRRPGGGVWGEGQSGHK